MTFARKEREREKIKKIFTKLENKKTLQVRTKNPKRLTKTPRKNIQITTIK